MTTILSKAFKKASDLPDEIQEQLALMLIEYIDFEIKWDKAFQDSQSQLAKMADKALEDFKTGQTKEMDLVLDRVSCRL